MTADEREYPHRQRRARARAPLDAGALEEMALAYVARFATSAGKLERYCLRKVRERGWDGDSPPDVAGLVARFAARGYIDDAAYAEAKSRSLLGRGYGQRRLTAAMQEAGIAEEDRHGASVVDLRRAAVRLAQRRRLGPFARDGAVDGDRALREKHIAAMVRAGHTLDNARAVIDATSRDEALDWAEPGEDEIS